MYNVCMYIYIYIYTYTCIYIYIYIYTYTYISIYLSLYICIYNTKTTTTSMTIYDDSHETTLKQGRVRHAGPPRGLAASLEGLRAAGIIASYSMI